MAAAAALVLAQAVTVADAVAGLALLFKGFSIRAAALRISLAVVMGMPPDRQGAMGNATMTVSNLNVVRRAQFLVAAARRVNADITSAISNRTSIREAIATALVRERRYYGQHLQAGWNRMDAAARTDSAAMQYGLLLSWNAVMDSHTSPECRAADGSNYRADVMPWLGYPGMVHPHCRCYPGRPIDGAKIIPAWRPAA
jgi:hypothetical protein